MEHDVPTMAVGIPMSTNLGSGEVSVVLTLDVLLGNREAVVVAMDAEIPSALTGRVDFAKTRLFRF